MNWRFEIYEALASTSDLCRSRAEAGEPDGLVILAKEQYAARGSRGRGWTTGKGNLSFSFLMHFVDDEWLQALPFLISVALYEALQGFLPGPQKAEKCFQLKWPNDLLLDGRKLAGILVETGYSGPKRWAVVGIGVNLQEAPVIEGRELACFAEKAPPPTSEICAHAIIESLQRWLQVWQKEGVRVVHQTWLSYAHPVGTRLAVKGRDTYMTGMFGGLDEQGRLLLTLESGEVVPVVTGDVLL
ncbi:biotin--[acetyl-CoA-carboxylase] ligase [Saccharibacter sp. 17.LH.SD]|nr:biotin--[acetyl-CoA-carboxylase] ligase [Saccharibacter sp. 17.LH.SD]